MRRKRFSSWIVFAGVLLLMSGASLSASVVRSWEQANGAQKLDKLTVRVDAAAALADSAGWTMEEAERFADAWAPLPVSWSARKADTVKHGDASAVADVVGIGGNDGIFTQRRYVSGGPITGQAVEERSRVAVLSAEMAERFFRSRNAAGATIRIGSVPFRIIGVYDEPASLLRTMTNDSRPDILIPISAMLDLYPGLTIQEIQAAAGSESPIDGEGGISEAIAASGKRAEFFTIGNDRSGHRWIAQKARLPVVAAGLGAIAVSLRLLVRSLLRLGSRIRLSMQTADLAETIARDRIWLLNHAAASGGLAAAVIALWLLIRFPLYIPPELVPDRWIDLSYYTDLLIGHWQSQADGAGLVPSAETLMRERVDGLVNGLTAAGLLAGLPLTWIGIREWKASGMDGGAMIIRIGFFVPAAAAIAFAAARQANFDFIVSPLETAVVCAWSLSVILYRHIISAEEGVVTRHAEI